MQIVIIHSFYLKFSCSILLADQIIIIKIYSSKICLSLREFLKTNVTMLLGKIHAKIVFKKYII